MRTKTKPGEIKKLVPHNKIGIVLSGGGMRCAYSGGVLVALANEYGLRSPGAIAADSGSVGNSIYYLARQYREIEKIWTDYIASPKFISRGGTRMNIDYLVDTIFKKLLPLHTERVDRTKTRYYFSVTDVAGGKLAFVTNDSPYDYLEVMRAAKAVPIIYGKRIRLGGKKYIDGGMSDSIQKLAGQARRTGVSNIIAVISDSPARPMVAKIALKLDALFEPVNLRKAILKHVDSAVGVCPTGMHARIVCMMPSHPLPVDEVTNDRAKLIATFKLGYDDAVRNRFLHAILGKPKRHGAY